MRRVRVAGVLLLFCLASCFAAELHMMHATDDLNRLLDEVTAAIESGDNAEMAVTVDALDDAWERHHKIMIRYIHNDEINAIHGTLARMRALAEYPDACAELSAETAHLRQSIRLIRDSQQTSVENIF